MGGAWGQRRPPALPASPGAAAGNPARACAVAKRVAGVSAVLGVSAAAAAAGGGGGVAAGAGGAAAGAGAVAAGTGGVAAGTGDVAAGGVTAIAAAPLSVAFLPLRSGGRGGAVRVPRLPPPGRGPLPPLPPPPAPAAAAASRPRGSGRRPPRGPSRTLPPQPGETFTPACDPRYAEELRKKGERAKLPRPAPDEKAATPAATPAAGTAPKEPSPAAREPATPAAGAAAASPLATAAAASPRNSVTSTSPATEAFGSPPWETVSEEPETWVETRPPAEQPTRLPAKQLVQPPKSGLHSVALALTAALDETLHEVYVHAVAARIPPPEPLCRRLTGLQKEARGFLCLVEAEGAAVAAAAAAAAAAAGTASPAASAALSVAAVRHREAEMARIFSTIFLAACELTCEQFEDSFLENPALVETGVTAVANARARVNILRREADAPETSFRLGEKTEFAVQSVVSLLEPIFASALSSAETFSKLLEEFAFRLQVYGAAFHNGSWLALYDNIELDLWKGAVEEAVWEIATRKDGIIFIFADFQFLYADAGKTKSIWGKSKNADLCPLATLLNNMQRTIEEERPKPAGSRLRYTGVSTAPLPTAKEGRDGFGRLVYWAYEIPESHKAILQSHMQTRVKKAANKFTLSEKLSIARDIILYNM